MGLGPGMVRDSVRETWEGLERDMESDIVDMAQSEGSYIQTEASV